MRPACLFAMVAAVLCGGTLPLAAQITAMDSGDVTLAIEKYCRISIRDPDIVMDTVTPDWYGKTRKTAGSSLLDLACNFPATVRVPETIVLEDGGSYTVTVNVSISGASGGYYMPGPGGQPDWVCVDFPPGVHDGEATVGVDLVKLWSYAEDVADTYTGVVTVEIVDDMTP